MVSGVINNQKLNWTPTCICSNRLVFYVLAFTALGLFLRTLFLTIFLFHDQFQPLQISYCSTSSWSLNNPKNIPILFLPAHVNCPPAAAHRPSGSCPVRCSSPPPPEPLQLCHCTSLHTAGGLLPQWTLHGPIPAPALMWCSCFQIQPLILILFLFLTRRPRGYF